MKFQEIYKNNPPSSIIIAADKNMIKQNFSLQDAALIRIVIKHVTVTVPWLVPDRVVVVAFAVAVSQQVVVEGFRKSA